MKTVGWSYQVDRESPQAFEVLHEAIGKKISSERGPHLRPSVLDPRSHRSSGADSRLWTNLKELVSWPWSRQTPKMAGHSQDVRPTVPLPLHPPHPRLHHFESHQSVRWMADPHLASSDLLFVVRSGTLLVYVVVWLWLDDFGTNSSKTLDSVCSGTGETYGYSVEF